MYQELKSKINEKYTIVFFIFFLCLLSTPIFLSKVYLGHDSLFHYQRIEQLAISLKNGAIFPTLQSGALGSQGYAGSLFYPDLFLLIPAFFVVLGLDRFNALSLFIFILNLVTFAISYLSLKYFLEDNENLKANNYVLLIGAICYVIYPYRLYSMIIRGAVSELIAMTFIPIIVLTYYKIFVKNEYKYWKLLSLGFTLLVLTHLVSALILAIVGVVFLFFNLKILRDKDFYKSMLKAIGLALLLTSYFLMPMIEQMLDGDYLYNLLPTISDSNLNPNKTIDVNVKKIIPFNLNQYILISINIIYIYISVKIIKKICSKVKAIYVYMIASILVFIYIFVLTTNLFPWATVKKIVPIIQQIQFPFRFYMLGGVPFSLFMCFGWVKKEENIISISPKLFVLSVMALMMTNMCGTRYFCSYERDYLVNEPTIKNSWRIGFGEFLPSNIENIKYKKGLKKEINDKNTITTKIYTNKILDKIYSKKKFNKLCIDLKDINIDKNIEKYNVSTELIYYKGYRALLDGKEVDILKDKNGRVKVLNIPSSSKNLVIEYIGTPIQKTSRIVSILSLCCLIICPKIKLNKKLV